MAIEAQEKPDFQNAEYKDMSPSWAMCRDAIAGTLEVRKKGDVYLPKNPKEPDASYTKRLSRAEFIPAFEKTVTSLTGMIFRKPLSVDKDIQEKILEYLGNIDLMGNDLENFAKALILDGLITGITHFLVDYPRTLGIQNLEQEIKLNVRPYWVHIKSENLLSWRHRQDGGNLILDQIVIREVTKEPSGQFGEVLKTRYRVLNPGKWKLLEIKQDPQTKEEVVVTVEEGTTTIDFIPLITLNFNPKGFMVAKPPLIELAIQNIAHYNVLADHRNSLHFAGLPLLVIEEEISPLAGNADIVISADTAIRTKPGSRVYYAEHSGNALGQSRQELMDIEARMAKSGLSMLAPNQTRDIKATQLIIEKSENDSKLSLIVKESQGALNKGLEYTAKWMGETPNGSISLNKDFDDATMSPDMMRGLSDMVSKGQLSLETMWDALVTGEILSDNFDKESEQSKIDSNLLGNVNGNTGGAGNENSPGNN